MKKISDFILQWSQKQLGTAKLEEKSITKIIKGVYSRTLSSIAMSSLPYPHHLELLYKDYVA